MRTFVMIFSCACVAIVLSEAAAVFLLWQRGVLSESNIREVQHILGGYADKPDPIPTAQQSPPQPSVSDVEKGRTTRVLDIERREAGLATLRQQVLDAQQRVEKAQDKLKAQREVYVRELEAAEKSLTETSTEQARAVLLALPPAIAVDRLMPLTVDRGVVLLKGMPEKSIAKILKEFTPAPVKVERGQQLFDAIYRGSPQKEVLEKAMKELAP